MASKKAPKSKLVSEDVMELMNQSYFLKKSPKPKKTVKRVSKIEPAEDEDMSRMIGEYQASAKKKKAEACLDSNSEYRNKILDQVDNQLEERKQFNENVFKSLSEITTQVEADYNAMKENEQKFEHLTENYMKCIKQATAACKQKLKDLNEICTSFRNECEKMDTDHKIATENLVNELGCDIKKLQEKLVAETKRSGWESLRRSIFNAMQNDF